MNRVEDAEGCAGTGQAFSGYGSPAGPTARATSRRLYSPPAPYPAVCDSTWGVAKTTSHVPPGAGATALDPAPSQPTIAATAPARINAVPQRRREGDAMFWNWLWCARNMVIGNSKYVPSSGGFSPSPRVQKLWAFPAAGAETPQGHFLGPRTESGRKKTALPDGKAVESNDENQFSGLGRPSQASRRRRDAPRTVTPSRPRAPGVGTACTTNWLTICGCRAVIRSGLASSCASV